MRRTYRVENYSLYCTLGIFTGGIFMYLTVALKIEAEFFTEKILLVCNTSFLKSGKSQSEGDV